MSDSSKSYTNDVTHFLDYNPHFLNVTNLPLVFLACNRSVTILLLMGVLWYLQHPRLVPADDSWYEPPDSPRPGLHHPRPPPSHIQSLRSFPSAFQGFSRLLRASSFSSSQSMHVTSVACSSVSDRSTLSRDASKTFSGVSHSVCLSRMS